MSAVEDADEDRDDAVAAHELAVVRRGGHGLEGERHLLEVAAAEHGDQRVDALHLVYKLYISELYIYMYHTIPYLGLDGLMPVAHALLGRRHGVDGRGEAHHGGRVVVLQKNERKHSTYD